MHHGAAPLEVLRVPAWRHGRWLLAHIHDLLSRLVVVLHGLAVAFVVRTVGCVWYHAGLLVRDGLIQQVLLLLGT